MTEEVVNEIGYADTLSNLNMSDSKIIQLSVKDGTIGQRPVMNCTVENTSLYYFTEGDRIAALVLLEDDKLRAIKNFTKQPEMVRALLNHLVNMRGITVKIAPNEPLTTEGFNWVVRTINNPHGIRVTDYNGEQVNVEKLKAEWEHAKSTRGQTHGNTGLIIGESTSEWKQRLTENEQRLMPFNYFDFSNAEINETGALNEIGYADTLSNLNMSDAEIIQMSTKDGTIGQKPVMMCTVGNTSLYYFTEDNRISALVLLAGNKLRAIKNFTKQPGLIRALVSYVVNFKNIVIEVSSDEQLTSEGLAWVIKLIKEPHGIKVTDLYGDAVDVENLKAEWLQSKVTGGATQGRIGLLISESSRKWKRKLQENEKSIMPYIFFDFSNSKIVNEINTNTYENKGISKLGQIGHNEFSWIALGEDISIDDKMSIVEEYCLKSNLTESIDEDKKDYFVSLSNMSDIPVLKNQYIVASLALVGNKIINMGVYPNSKFLGKSNQIMLFNVNGEKKSFPTKTMRDLSVFNTFTFSTVNAYDKFKVALAMKFDTSLPAIAAEHIKESKNTMSNTKYVGRETKEGTWRVFKSGQAVAVAGPFKSAEEARAWITSAEKEDQKKQGVAEAAKWRSNPSAYDVDDEGNKSPKTANKFSYDPLTHRQNTAGDSKTARGKKWALKTSIKMAKGQHGPKGILPEQDMSAPKHIQELSPQTLASYKKKAGAAASEADKRGEFEKGHKRFKGIMKATKKEFEQDRKNVRENAESTADKKTEAKIAALEKKIKDAQDALGLARERRKMRGQRQQGPREITLGSKLDDLRQQLHMVKVSKKTAVNEDREYYAAERALADAKIAKENGDMGDYYTLMAEYHDNMMQWNQSKGRYNAADRDAEKVKQYTDAAQKHNLYSNVNEDGLIGNPSDKVTMDVPLMIRIMEYAREDAQTDMDLHNVAEQLIKLSASGKTLSMQDYDSIVSQQNENKIFELGATGSAIGSVARAQTTTGTPTSPTTTQANTQPTGTTTTSTTTSPTIAKPTVSPTTSPTTTAAKPGATNLKPDEQDALNKIMTNAGLKTQFQQLVQKSKTVPGA